MKTSCQVAKAGVTRRGFLGLAAASAVIAGSGIAGCSPAKPSKTDADAEQAQTALEIAESEIKETKEADVVVVGLGVAGVAAMSLQPKQEPTSSPLKKRASRIVARTCSPLSIVIPLGNWEFPIPTQRKSAMSS